MSANEKSPGMLIARLDRIPVWSLPGLFIGIIGVGFLFTFYDIFDINVSFIQTCTQIVPNCTPHSTANYIGLPVLLNLVGYVIGTLVLSPLADRAGRRDLLLVTMVITGIGSVLTAVVDNYSWFVVARTITGIGIGADLGIVNTYINEMAPRQGRARYERQADAPAAPPYTLATIMWITPQDEALQAQSAAIVALLISLFGFAWKRNRLWLSFLCLTATALVVAAIVVADLGT